MNGTLLTSSSGSISSTGASSADLQFGDFYGANFNGKGSLDEVAIWSRTLNTAEIRQLYQRGASRLKFQARSCIAADCSNAAD